MALKNWQTGKGYCLGSIRGQLSVYGPVLNKVPINNLFIRDRNQCNSDSVSQLTLLIASADQRGERKRTWVKD